MDDPLWQYRLGEETCVKDLVQKVEDSRLFQGVDLLVRDDNLY